MSERTAPLQSAIDRLEARVSALEAQGDTAAAPQGGSGSKPQGGSAETLPGNDPLWALTQLQATLPDHPATVDGAVMLVGSLTLPTGGPVAWQEGAATTELFESDWTDHAAAFAALGHPVRLELLRHILAGTSSTAELTDVAALGTTGQLHHHLRQLVATGWVRQIGRGHYEVPAARVVPLLASVTAVRR